MSGRIPFSGRKRRGLRVVLSVLEKHAASVLDLEDAKEFEDALAAIEWLEQFAASRPVSDTSSPFSAGRPHRWRGDRDGKTVTCTRCGTVQLASTVGASTTSCSTGARLNESSVR